MEKVGIATHLPQKTNPGQKLILKGKGENDLVIEGKTTSIPDLMSRPDTVRPGAQACSWYSINACWNGFFSPTELNPQDVTLNEPARLKDFF